MLRNFTKTFIKFKLNMTLDMTLMIRESILNEGVGAKEARLYDYINIYSSIIYNYKTLMQN